MLRWQLTERAITKLPAEGAAMAAAEPTREN